MIEINGIVVKCIGVAWAEHCKIKDPRMTSEDLKMENYTVYYENVDNRSIRIHFYPIKYKIERTKNKNSIYYMPRHPYNSSSFVVDTEKMIITKIGM